MRNVGREVSGAWRSLRYDLTRRPVPPVDDAPTDLIYPEYEPVHRPRRRLVLAATTFGALSLVGATGTYFAVINGLSALASEETAPPKQLPAVAGAPSPTPTVRGVAPVPSATPGRTGPPPAGGAAPSPSGRAVLGKAPARPGAPRPTCACVTPPVPTPTSPPPVAETPDPPVSSTPPAPTGSASPDPTPGPSDPPPAGG